MQKPSDSIPLEIRPPDRPHSSPVALFADDKDLPSDSGVSVPSVVSEVARNGFTGPIVELFGNPPVHIVDATNPGVLVDSRDLHIEDGKPADF